MCFLPDIIRDRLRLGMGACSSARAEPGTEASFMKIQMPNRKLKCHFQNNFNLTNIHEVNCKSLLVYVSDSSFIE